MPSQRDKSKKLIGFYATPEEKKALEEAAKKRGISVAEPLRRLAAGTLKLLIIGILAFHAIRSPRKWSAAALGQSAKLAWTHVSKLAR